MDGIDWKMEQKQRTQNRLGHGLMLAEHDVTVMDELPEMVLSKLPQRVGYSWLGRRFRRLTKR